MNRTKKLFILSLSFCLFISLFFSFCLFSENTIQFTEYNIETGKIKNNVRIALISDLHHKEFGKNNINLVNAVSRSKPDLIAIVGDMITISDTDHQIVIDLLEQMTEIAPTYYVAGNHELSYARYEQLKDDIKATGTIFLDNEMVQFSADHMNGETITIGGLTEFPYYDFYYPHYENEERYFLEAFIEQQEQNFAVLLAHQPEFYFWKLSTMNIDLMLSGHTHGGLVRIPGVGGVYAPNQNIFPEYDKGYFSSATTQMIITGGLGNTCFIPRLNNNPEVCIINIRGKN